VLLAATWRDMASLLIKRGLPLKTLRLFNNSTSASASLLGRYVPGFSNSHNTVRQSSSAQSAMSESKLSADAFLEYVKHRRSYYQLSPRSPISDKKIEEVVRQTVLHVPSSFNSQPTRVILLLKKEHEKFWDIVTGVLRGLVPADKFAPTEKKLGWFKAGYGTVLFYESLSTTNQFAEKYALYADKFPIWTTQSDAMHQFAIWTALEAEGLGVNLQHYNPVIDQKVAEAWNVPSDWQLNAQLVFGTPAGEPSEKTFLPVDERFKVFGA